MPEDEEDNDTENTTNNEDEFLSSGEFFELIPLRWYCFTNFGIHDCIYTYSGSVYTHIEP
jgi:hypothetical protein